MPHPWRLALSAALLVGGWFASEAVRGLAYDFENFGVRVGFEMLGLEIGLGALALALALALPGSAPSRLGLAPSRLPWSALLAVGIGVLGLSAAIDGGLSMVRAAQTSKTVGISRELAKTPSSAIAFALFATALAPALCEELLCRGVVQRSLARRAGPWLAVPLAAAFFGALHQEWIHGSVAFAIGLYLGVVAFWADSTRPAIAAHFANNAVALLGSMGLLRIRAGPWTSIAIGMLLATAGLLWAARLRPRAPAAPAADAALMPDPESADA